MKIVDRLMKVFGYVIEEPKEECTHKDPPTPTNALDQLIQDINKMNLEPKLREKLVTMVSDDIPCLKKRGLLGTWIEEMIADSNRKMIYVVQQVTNKGKPSQPTLTLDEFNEVLRPVWEKDKQKTGFWPVDYSPAFRKDAQ